MAHPFLYEVPCGRESANLVEEVANQHVARLLKANRRRAHRGPRVERSAERRDRLHAEGIVDNENRAIGQRHDVAWVIEPCCPGIHEHRWLRYSPGSGATHV